MTGRSLPAGSFRDDDGAADPALARALEAYRDGAAGLEVVVAALAASRLLVPVVAAGAAAGTAARTEMALVTLRGPHGRATVPVFTSVDAMRAWDPDARPVPFGARRVALAAVAERADVLVVDAGGPVMCVLPRPAVWAIAQGRGWTPSPKDPEVLAAARAACAAEPAVADVGCQPGERAELRVVLAVRPGLDRAALDALTRSVSRRLAASQIVADRVDSVELRITPATDHARDH